MSDTGNLNLPIAEIVSAVEQIRNEIETVRYDWNSLSADMCGAEQGWGGDSVAAAAILRTAFDKVGTAVLTALSDCADAVTKSVEALSSVDGATAAALTSQQEA
ncbi:hypothetical protein [Nocardia sp. GTS18]|uniref:hypothetical protein n=1 Tax=Nocardia sp. GTS18 TaxID=1778064 RepID=UPI0015EED73B|nr:hypothetical protein [Nocardia sp. GTS18]